MATESFVQVAPDGGGKDIDAFAITSGSLTLYRQSVVIGDPTTAANTVNIQGDGYMPVSQNSVNFQAGTGNTSTAQLAAGATFTGVIESVLSQTGLSLIIDSDQSLSVTINQYIAIDPSTIISSWTYFTSGDFSRSLVLNGNYANVVVTNTSATTTTALNINTYYGTIDSTTQLGNKPIAINEIGGMPVPSAGLPVTDGGGSFSVDTGTPGQPLNVTSTADVPVFAAITGDPSGDFAGVNLLEAAMDSTSGLGLTVRVQNPPLVDVKGAAVQSDAPASIPLQGAIGAAFIIDTTGYQTINIQSTGLAGNVTCSDDGATWFALSGVNRVLAAAYVTAVTANGAFSFPAMARYVRIVLTTAGSGVAYLRSAVWNGEYVTPLAANVSQIAGTNTVTAGVGGMQAVGGNIAPGTAPTANPLGIGGVDSSGLTRRMLTDTRGAHVVVGSTDAAAQPVLVQQNTATVAQEAIVDLLTKILFQERVNGLFLRELPGILASSTLTTTYQPPQTTDDETTLRDDLTWGAN